MIKVIIIDDHPIVRAGMQTILAEAPDIQVLAEGSTASEALQLVAQHDPDVLILDINLPDSNGLQVTRHLIDQGSRCKILALTAMDDDEIVFGLLESGAAGYVLKDEALENLVSAVRCTAKDQSWLSPSVASQIIKRLSKEELPHKDAFDEQQEKDHPDALTEREKEVLSLLAMGLDNQAIAETLMVTVRTVQNHVSNIYAKLGTSSRTQAALAAFRMGLAHPPGSNETS